MKKRLFLFWLLFLPVLLIAGRPKSKHIPGINDGLSSGASETSLTVGLPIGNTALPSVKSSTESNTPAGSRIVYTFELNDENEASAVNQTKSAFRQAKTMNASCVLIRMNSYQGYQDAAEYIRQEILEYDRPVMIYVEDEPSANGALISLSCDSIYKKSKKGKAATAPQHTAITGNTAQKAFSKKQPNSTYGSPAAPSTASSAHVLDQACNAEASNIQEVLYRAGLKNYALVNHKAGITERIFDFLLQPPGIFLIIAALVFFIALQPYRIFPGPVTFGWLIAAALLMLTLHESLLASATEMILMSLALLTYLIAAKRNLIFSVLSAMAVIFCMIMMQLPALQTLHATDLKSILTVSGLTLSGVLTGRALQVIFSKPSGVSFFRLKFQS